MTARFEIGEVLLATSIGDVLRQLRVAVVPGNPSLSHHLAEGHSIHLREFGGFAERKRSLSIERDGQFGAESLLNLPFGNEESLEHRVRDNQAHPHAPTIPRSDGQKPLVVPATICTEPRRAGLVGRIAAANPVEFQLIHAPEFRISRHQRTVTFLRQGGRERIGVGNRESGLQ